MTLLRYLLACGALCAPVAAFADDTPPAPPINVIGQKPADPKPLEAPKAVVDLKLAKAPDRQVCREQAEMGSFIKTHKVCMTAAQWREQQFKANQWIEHQTTYNRF